MTCSLCDRPVKARGWCNTHYQQYTRGTRTGGVLKHGQGCTSTGYRRFGAAGHISEHRMVMAEHLGRELHTDEHVHHIDGDKLNNDIANLQILTVEEHARLHAAIR